MSALFPPTTLFEALSDTASSGRGRLVFHLQEGIVELSSEELLDRALVAGAALEAWGIRPGDTVGVLGPNRPEWATWALAAWAAGAVLVPIPFPLRIRDADSFQRQSRRLIDVARCRAVLAHPSYLGGLPSGVRIPWDTPPPLTRALPEPRVPSDDRAVIQFTSGSTAGPKGAVLSHAAVLAAFRSINLSYDRQEEDRLVSWLPFFHDNGLFLHLVGPMVAGRESHIIPTERFARSPLTWWQIASEVGATITSGPSSAWGLALRSSSRRPAGIDLSTLRLGIMAAEMIDPKVVDQLVQWGEPLGLAPGTLCGGYGMAEVTLGATRTPPRKGIRLDQVDVAELAEGRAMPARGDPTKRVASCGTPMMGVQIEVWTEGGPAGERHIGEVLVKAPSAMLGYLGEAVPDPFIDGWLRTGDLGYLADGELFITGRIKDIIIVHGRNYSPEDVEWAAGGVSGVRPGRCIAFAPPGEDGHVLVALEANGEGSLAELTAAVRQAVFNRVGLTVRDVLVLPKGGIPFTTSGKLQRSAVRNAYARGELNLIASGAV